MSTRRVLPLVLLLASLAGMSTTAQSPAPTPAPAQRTPQEIRDMQAVLQTVDSVSAGRQAAPTDISVSWESNHFLGAADGMTFVPFTLNIDPKLAGRGAVFYVRVMTKEQVAAAATPVPAPAPAAQGNNRNQSPPAAPPRVAYPWDELTFIEVPANGIVQRAVMVKPGDYEILIGVKEKSVGEPAPNAPPTPMGLLRRELSAPNFANGDLQTSSVLVLDALEDLPAPLSPQQQKDNPYTIGTLKFVLAKDLNFTKAERIHVWYWVYGAQARDSKPDLTLEHGFFQKTADGEKFFVRTMPQELNAMTLPPQFDLAIHQVLGELPVPLTTFPVGNYRLEIKVTDKVAGKSVTRDVNFSVVE